MTIPTPRNSRELIRLGLVAFALVATAHVLVGWGAHAFVNDLPVLCLFRRVTGLECPGCGMTRALALLTEGDVPGSLQRHPFGLFLLLGAAVWALLPEAALARLKRWKPIQSPVLPVGLLVALLGWWITAKILGHSG